MKKEKGFQKQKGSVLIITGLMAPIILGVSIIGCDLGRLYILGSALQNSADLAALSGARALHHFNEANPTAEPSLEDYENITSTVVMTNLQYPEKIDPTMNSITHETSLGNYSKNGAYTPNGSPPTAVHVKIHYEVKEKSFVVKFIGFQNRIITREATAHFCPGPRGFVLLGGVCPCENGRWEGNAPISEVCDPTAGNSPIPAYSCDAGYNHDAPPPPCPYCDPKCTQQNKPGRWCGDNIVSDGEDCDSPAGGNCQIDCCSPGRMWDPDQNRCVDPPTCRKLTASFAVGGAEPVILRVRDGFDTKIYDSRKNSVTGNLPNLTFCVKRDAAPDYAYTLNSNARATSLTWDKSCGNSCEGSLCGNGAADTGEQCDDGNFSNSDGCSDVCQCDGNLQFINGKCEAPPPCSANPRYRLGMAGAGQGQPPQTWGDWAENGNITAAQTATMLEIFGIGTSSVRYRLGKNVAGQGHPFPTWGSWAENGATASGDTGATVQITVSNSSIRYRLGKNVAGQGQPSITWGDWAENGATASSVTADLLEITNNLPQQCLCGNGSMDANEQCDSGANCNASCQCPAGYEYDGNKGCKAIVNSCQGSTSARLCNITSNEANRCDLDMTTEKCTSPSLTFTRKGNQISFDVRPFLPSYGGGGPVMLLDGQPICTDLTNYTEDTPICTFTASNGCHTLQGSRYEGANCTEWGSHIDTLEAQICLNENGTCEQPQSLCGNSTINAGEQCDGGLGCTTACLCDSFNGYVYQNGSCQKPNVIPNQCTESFMVYSDHASNVQTWRSCPASGGDATDQYNQNFLCQNQPNITYQVNGNKIRFSLPSVACIGNDCYSRLGPDLMIFKDGVYVGGVPQAPLDLEVDYNASSTYEIQSMYHDDNCECNYGFKQIICPASQSASTIDLSVDALTTKPAASRFAVPASSATYDENSQIEFITTVRNSGTAAASNTALSYYFTLDASKKDQYPNGFTQFKNEAGISVPANGSTPIAHSHTNGASSGSDTYYIVACVDPQNTVSETSESNNCSVPATVIVKKVVLTPTVSITATTGNVCGGQINLSWSGTNVTQYAIFRQVPGHRSTTHGHNTDGWFLLLDNTTSTVVTDNVTPGLTHYYAIWGTNDDWTTIANNTTNAISSSACALTLTCTVDKTTAQINEPVRYTATVSNYATKSFQYVWIDPAGRIPAAASTRTQDVITFGSSPFQNGNFQMGVEVTVDSKTITAQCPAVIVGNNVVCGNGQKEGTEQCDDGNQNNTDNCSNACENQKTIEVHLNDNIGGLPANSSSQCLVGKQCWDYVNASGGSAFGGDGGNSVFDWCCATTCSDYLPNSYLASWEITEVSDTTNFTLDYTKQPGRIWATVGGDSFWLEGQPVNDLNNDGIIDTLFSSDVGSMAYHNQYGNITRARGICKEKK